jgi:hypothetical protein
MVGGYHSLNIIETLADTKSPAPAGSLPPQQLGSLEQANLSDATKQAQLYIDRLTEVLRLDPSNSPEHKPGALGMPYLPAVISAIARPQARFSDKDRRVIGQIYSKAICKWIEVFQSSSEFRGQPVILFTSPSVYSEYNMKEAPCGLSKNLVWVSYHSLDGDAPSVKDQSDSNRDVRALCERQDGSNRCLFQQYTSYGGFAVFQKDVGLDLDRFLGTEGDLENLLQSAPS